MMQELQRTEPDEILLMRVREGSKQSEEELIRKYSRMVRSFARPYFLVGGDSEDLIQEGMIGLLKAVREYDPAKQTNFYTFAVICVKRQLISAIRNANRLKHSPLNNYVSLGEPLFNDNAGADNLIRAQAYEPDDLFEARDEIRDLKEALSDLLSVFEAKVLDCYLSGKTLDEISKEIGKSRKSLDNAIQRVKRKLEGISISDSR
ncbi:MAG: sigma-70 family RNA polymerase sigma factor [Clostridiales bacterium]|nr:sigma-70 family RNA polymerase sigma factor [Clostridiales bacterium]